MEHSFAEEVKIFLLMVSPLIASDALVSAATKTGLGGYRAIANLRDSAINLPG
jgi:hypothetical protein